MQTKDNLLRLLNQIDGRGYKAYKDIQGIYDFQEFELAIDYVQGDPFATPSRIRVVLDKQKTGIHNDLFDLRHKRVAVTDYLARVIRKNIDATYKRVKGSGKSGLLEMDFFGQKVLEKTAVSIDKARVEIRIEVGLPAAGRRVLSREAIKIFFDYLPRIVGKSIYKQFLNHKELASSVKLAEDQYYIRQYLQENKAVAFIANGAILPRISGISDKPMSKGVIPFKSPETMEVSLELPHKGTIKGMLIREGITLIVGGGYHGKSTLLNAIEMSVYNHIHGDGREYCITREDAMKIRAEDGRRVEEVDISLFINNLPNGMDTKRFSTDNASGSTSQAANIVEALEASSKLLLIDEDTSATNFMIRDARMKQLVHEDKEPITPFIDRVKQLYEKDSVSTVLVIGGSGDYFDVADQVIMMDEYRPIDKTKEAYDIAKTIGNSSPKKVMAYEKSYRKRKIMPITFKSQRNKLKVIARGLSTISYNKCDIDLKHVEQLIDSSQTRALAQILTNFSQKNNCQNLSLEEAIDELLILIEKDGLECLSTFRGHPGNLALPRKLEIIATINRFRQLKIRHD
ncbi:ABC-ATPase domain-containing protein [Vallitalea okinawensis]|uniref:ABC-ATPase domain-containing protein n=1 Tax=Vallitalea okinawensis TaxID=2078660 RepID=UPI000CFE19E6|nr:ABC-ATPase domain-containing protein [Vallitalea okinawensis]